MVKYANTIIMDTGIYSITNIINRKIYIGSGILNKRKAYHLYYLRNNKHRNPHLQASWNKYGEENFKFEILEICDSNLCVSLESKWINKLNTKDNRIGYNINDPQEGRRGIKHSKEALERMSKAHIGNLSNTGRKLTDEHRKNLCKARATSERPEDIGLRIAEGKKKKLGYDLILQFDLNGNLLKEWNTFSEIYKELGIDTSCISGCCKNLKSRKTAGGFIWKFK